MNRNALHQVFEAALSGKSSHKSWLLQDWQEVQGNTASKIEPTRREDFQSQVSGLAREN